MPLHLLTAVRCHRRGLLLRFARRARREAARQRGEPRVRRGERRGGTIGPRLALLGAYAFVNGKDAGGAAMGDHAGKRSRAGSPTARHRPNPAPPDVNERAPGAALEDLEHGRNDALALFERVSGGQDALTDEIRCIYQLCSGIVVLPLLIALALQQLPLRRRTDIMPLAHQRKSRHEIGPAARVPRTPAAALATLLAPSTRADRLYPRPTLDAPAPRKAGGPGAAAASWSEAHSR